MSAARIPAVRTLVRQFAIAMVACTAVAGGAALAAAPDAAPAATSQQAGAENDWPKAPTPSPVVPTN
ncbi:hypothetical protein AB0D99_34655 [Streptomyces sp. NPDC047971]|uniref:hypothetical protein n=1 Tax=Streptomyces sp. NPDC047971 TaxID=3154499 RepID=UPI0033DBB7F0